MSIEREIQAAMLAALASPEGQKALRRALIAGDLVGAADDQAYTVAQVAELSGYSAPAILDHIDACNLRAYKPRGGREWRVRRADYNAWLTGAGAVESAAVDPDAVVRKMLGSRDRG